MSAKRSQAWEMMWFRIFAHLQEDQNRESTDSIHEDAGTIGSADAERPEMDIR